MDKNRLHSAFGGWIQMVSADRLKISYPQTTHAVEVDLNFEALAESIKNNTPVQDDEHKVVIISNPENIRICSMNSIKEIKIPREHFLAYIS